MIVSRELSWLGVFFTIIIFLTYRSFNQVLFYFSWSAGLLVIILTLGLFICYCRFPIIVIKTLSITGLWLFWAVFVTPFSTDINHHVNILIISFYYILASSLLVFLLTNSSIKKDDVFFLLMTVWVVVNGFLFFLFLIGIYEPVKRDFSGVFHDRNVFSITTLIIMVFTLSFGGGSRFWKIFNVFICVNMIIISKSVTGFLGLLFLAAFLLNKLSFYKKLILSFLLIASTVGVLNLDNPLKNRIDRFYMAATGNSSQLNNNESAFIRMYLVTGGISLASENLFFGVGLDNARLHIMWPDRNTGTFLHNTYLDIITSGGVVMFVMYYVPVFLSLLWLLFVRKKVERISLEAYAFWKSAFLLLALKILYDFTWTTYFEFVMVFSVVYSVYVSLMLKKILNYEKNTLHS